MSSKRNRQPTSPKYLLVLLLAPTILALAACRDDSAGPGEDRMTQDEANALAQALYGGELLTFGQDMSAVQNIPPGATIPVETTLPCQGGGQATFSGQVSGFLSAVQDSLGMRLSGVLIPTGCVVSGDGVTFTLDGMPSIEQEGSIAIALSTFTTVLDFSASGSVNWTSGTKAGNCGVDTDIDAVIEINLDPSAPRPTATVTGSLCGRTIDRTITLPATITEG